MFISTSKKAASLWVAALLACVALATASWFAGSFTAYADEGANEQSATNQSGSLLTSGEIAANQGDASGDASDGQNEGDAQDQGGNDKKKKKVANPKVTYKAMSAGKWINTWKKQATTVGKKGKDLQQIKVKVNLDGLKGSVEYRTYELRKGGWTDWAKDGAAAGIKNWHMRGLQMRLTGTLGKKFDIVYRVHLKDAGWQPWTLNGALAGSKGTLAQIDQLQVKLVSRSEESRPTVGTYFISPAKDSTKAVSVPGENKANNKQMKEAEYKETSQGERFYLRKAGSGTVLLQSVFSGKYLYDKGGKVVQREYAEKDRFRWEVSWKGGWLITNVGTGNALALSDGKIVTAAEGERWCLSDTSLLADEHYSLINNAKGKVLTMENGSKRNGAALIVQNQEESGEEVFEFVHKGSDVYQIKNVISNKVMAVKASSKKNGADVRQYESKNVAAQKWKVTLTREGTFVLKNKASGNVLGVTNAGKNGAAVQSVVDEEAKVQRWSIEKADYSLTGDYALDASIQKILSTHKTLRSCFNYVVSFKYRSGSKYGKYKLSDSTTSKMAKEMISHHSGNCYRFAALFSWLARGLGYHTTVRAGSVPSASGGWAPHGWVEVHKNGKTYVCDPDLAHELPGHNWYMTTYSSAPVSYNR